MEPSSALFVGNISADATIEALKAEFAQFGQIANAFLHRNHDTGGHKGSAFVFYHNADDAKKALAALNKKPFFGKELLVEWKKSASLEESRKRGNNQVNGDAANTKKARTGNESAMKKATSLKTPEKYARPRRFQMRVRLWSLLCWHELLVCGRRSLDREKMQALVDIFTENPGEIRRLLACAYLEVACCDVDFNEALERRTEDPEGFKELGPEMPAILMEGNVRFFALLRVYNKKDLRPAIKAQIERAKREDVTIYFNIFTGDASVELAKYLALPVIRGTLTKGLPAALLRLSAQLEQTAMDGPERAHLSLGEKVALATEGIQRLRQMEISEKFFHHAFLKEFILKSKDTSWYTAYRIAALNERLRGLIQTEILSSRSIKIAMVEVRFLKKLFESGSEKRAKVEKELQSIGKQLRNKEGIDTTAQVKSAFRNHLGMPARVRAGQPRGAKADSRRYESETSDDSYSEADEEEPVLVKKKSADSQPQIVIHNTNIVSAVACAAHFHPAPSQFSAAQRQDSTNSRSGAVNSKVASARIKEIDETEASDEAGPSNDSSLQHSTRR